MGGWIRNGGLDGLECVVDGCVGRFWWCYLKNALMSCPEGAMGFSPAIYRRGFSNLELP